MYPITAAIAGPIEVSPCLQWVFPAMWVFQVAGDNGAVHSMFLVGGQEAPSFLCELWAEQFNPSFRCA